MMFWAALLGLLAAPGSTLEDCRKRAAARDEAGALACFLALAEAAADPREKAEALYQSGRSQFALGDYKAAIETYEKALQLRRQAGDLREQGILLNSEAAAYFALGECNLALDRYQAALPLRRAASDRSGEAVTEFGIAQVNAAWGDWESAILAYDRSLAIFRELDNRPYQAEMLNARGLAYATIGDYDQALSSYKEALAEWRRLGNRGREAYTLNNMGLLELDRRAPAQAREYFIEARPGLEFAKDVRAQSYLLNNLGDAEAALGRRAKALELYAASLELKQKLGDKAGQAFTFQKMGEALAAGGEHTAALASLGSALALYREMGSRPGEATTLTLRARVERDQKRLGEARSDMETALATIESLRDQFSNRDLRTTFFSTRQDYYAFLVDLLMEMGEPAAAFEVNERSRARVLLDTLQEARLDPHQDIPLELLNRKRSVERELRALAQRPSAKSRLDEQLKELGEIEAAIRRSSPRRTGLLAPEPLKLDDVRQRVLDFQTVLLQVALGEERSFAWLVDAGGIVPATLPPRRRFEQLTSGILSALEARSTIKPGESPEQHQARVRAADGRFARQSAELSTLLLGPFREKLSRTRRLLIVPDGALNYVPFAALPLPGRATPLISEIEIVRAPSASTVAALRTAETSIVPRRLAIAVADPVFDAGDPRSTLRPAADSSLSRGSAGYGRLRFSAVEAENLASFDPARSRVLSGFEANRAAILSGALRGYRIVHFATHAEIDNSRPALSRIVLSGLDDHGRNIDGSLRLFEIYDLRLDAGLVVLSACRSALGREVRGEGLLGLTRGFLYAGASSVVASLWDVEDRSTATLMREFYSNLIVRKLNPAAALRAAQRTMAADTRWSHPYYWAAFHLQGDWNLPSPLK